MKFSDLCLLGAMVVSVLDGAIAPALLIAVYFICERANLQKG